ncbi:ATP-binding protein [Streptomyces hundungensis]|uniref:ATP-binding protein n=1 Tax=Streptomyces hundungensis TaxID=1077946 RepID=UPI0033CBFB78
MGVQSAHPAFPAAERTLRELVNCAARPPSLLVLSGEEGIGKSHLARLLLADPALAPQTRLSGRCLALRQPLPLQPIIDALAAWSPPPHSVLPSVTGALRPLFPELSRHLPAGLVPLLDELSGQILRFRALRALLDATGQTILMIEDLQWADHTTLDFLQQLLASPLPRLTLVLTHRDDPTHMAALRDLLVGAPPLGAQRIDHRLSPLSTTEVGAMATARLDDHSQTVKQDFIHALHRYTGGNPGAVTEVIHSLATQAPGIPPGVRAVFAVPDGARRRTLAALRTLPADARAVVEAAAVTGGPVTTNHLAALTGLPLHATEQAVEHAWEHAMLHPEPGTDAYRLRHPLAQQAVYDNVPLYRQRALHLRTARALSHQHPPPLARIAHHYRYADRAAQWLRYAEAAADRAAHSAEHDAAADLLLDALTAAPTHDRRIRLALKLGRAALHARHGHHAIDAMGKVLDHDEPAAPNRGELRLARGILMRNQGHGTAGLDEIAAALPDLTTRPDLAARAMAAVALPSTTGWPLSEHLAWMERAHHLAPHTPDPALRLAISVNRAGALMFTADPRAWQAADAIPHTADTCPEKLEIARGNANLAHAATLLGHPRRAGAFLARAHANLDHTQSYLTGHAATAQLLLEWCTGQWSGLDNRAATAAADYADIPDLAAESTLVQGLHALATRGDLNAARYLLRRAADTTRYDTGVVLPAAAAALARIETAAGHYSQAIEATKPTLAHLRRTGGWMWGAHLAPVHVEALVKEGHHASAQDLMLEFAAGIADRDAPAAHAALITCQALLAQGAGNHDDAAERHQSAALSWHRIQRPYEAARATEAQGASLLLLTDAAAQPTLLRALDAYSELGATWDAARTRHHVREQGMVLPHRRGPRGYGNNLSPREREVAQLAATGHSNQQIAQALCLSPRTIEQHVAKALRKLNLRSRNDLPAPKSQLS